MPDDLTEYSLNQHSGSHHGHPILTQRDVDLLLYMSKWIEVVSKFNTVYPKPFIPTHADILKSRLFWRIRSGKEPLKFPPPTAYSCPWYELIDDPERAHFAYELWTYKDTAYAASNEEFANKVSIAQCTYWVTKWCDEPDKDGKTWPEKVRFGPYHCKVWFGDSPYAKGHSGWWLQLEYIDPTYVWSKDDR